MARKRRGNGEGSISKRSDGRWHARVSLPDGKRKHFYGRTRDEVRKKLDKAKATGRIDGLQAMAMAIGGAVSMAQQTSIGWLL